MAGTGSASDMDVSTRAVAPVGPGAGLLEARLERANLRRGGARGGCQRSRAAREVTRTNTVISII